MSTWMPTEADFDAADAYIGGLIARIDAMLASSAEWAAALEADRAEATRLCAEWGLVA